MPSTLTGACAALAAALLSTSSAHAGPVEVLAQAQLDARNPCHVGLRFLNGLGGLLLSNDGGRTFRMRCSGSFDEAGAFGDDAFVFDFGADGAPLVGSFAGLASGDAAGCGFAHTLDPLVEGRVTDFAAHPNDPDTTYFAVTGASAGARNGIVARDAEGHLSALGADDTDPSSGSVRFIVNRLRLAARSESEGGVRFYESGGVRQGDGSLVPALRYSDDGAQTWTEHEIPAASAAADVLLWAVDPTDPARLLFSYRDATGRGSGDEVYVSADAGATRAPWIDDAVSEVSAVAVHPDGRVWLGDAGSTTTPAVGLWYADSFGDAPSKLSALEVRCLALREQDGSLFGCDPSAYGRIDTASGELTPLFTFSYTEGFVQCDGEPLASRCEEQLCADYCGPLHYAEAPLCTAYDKALCGPEADSAYFPEGKNYRELTHVVDALCPHPDDDGAAPTADAGTEADAGGNDAGLPESPEAGPTAPDAGEVPAGSSGGCHAAPSAHGPWALAAAAFLAAVAVVRRRLRRAARSKASRPA